MRWLQLFLLLVGFVNGVDGQPRQTEVPLQNNEQQLSTETVASGSANPVLSASDINLTKDFLFDKYLLKDEYPYKDTVRTLKWSVIRQSLAFIENIQSQLREWGVLQNYKNANREAPLVRHFVRNAYRRIADTLGVERYQ